MRHQLPLALVLAFLLPHAALAAEEGADTPASAYTALQKAAKAKDADAMAAVLTEDEREALRSEVKEAGIEIAARRVPDGALKITFVSDALVSGEVDGHPILFVRQKSRWYVAAIFAKPKKPVATIQPAPSVRVEGGAALTVKPIRGAGMPDKSAISGARAYELLRNEALGVRPNARLYSLDTGMHALSAAGTSSGWLAEFLTDKPGELLTVMYSEGDVEPPYVSSAPDRPGVPEPDAVGYDTKKLVEETMQYATGVVDPITRITASLYRSAGSGKALWLLNVYGDDDRIGQTVVFDAKTMKFSHKTK